MTLDIDFRDPVFSFDRSWIETWDVPNKEMSISKEHKKLIFNRIRNYLLEKFPGKYTERLR